MLVILASPVMLFIHQMVSGTESHESGVVRRRWDGDGACAAHVCVAQLVGEDLQLVSRKAIVVPQDVVVWGSAGALRRGPQNVTHNHRHTAMNECLHRVCELTWIPAWLHR